VAGEVEGDSGAIHARDRRDGGDLDLVGRHLRGDVAEQRLADPHQPDDVAGGVAALLRA
jgi:hypothetical protein